jgi:hypothetical protein
MPSRPLDPSTGPAGRPNRVPRGVSRPFETQLVIHCPPQHVATVLERVPWSLTISPESTSNDTVFTTDWLENRAYEADDPALLRERTKEFGCGSQICTTALGHRPVAHPPAEGEPAATYAPLLTMRAKPNATLNAPPDELAD